MGKHEAGLDDVSRGITRLDMRERITEASFKAMLERHPRHPRLMMASGGGCGVAHVGSA